MAYVRGQERLVYEAVKDYLTAQLTALGWIGPAPHPFGATTGVELLDTIPEKTAPLAVNTIAFTSGVDQADMEGELGCASGGLWVTDHVFFLDIFGENQGISKAIQADIRAMMTGRLPGSSRYFPFVDKTQTPPVTPSGHLLHFEDVVSDTPLGQDYKRDWRIVKCTVVHEYNAAEVSV